MGYMETDLQSEQSVQSVQKFVQHKMIKPELIQQRIYQEILAVRVLDRGNSLVVAPTALGKTIVAVLIAAELLKKNSDAKIVFLSPTKPLAEQHKESFRKFMQLPEEKISLLTGTISPSNRAEVWDNASIISATPQTIENSAVSGDISFQDVELLVFDEAHRASGDYSYVYLARKYMKQAKKPLILALTASPGSEEEKIQEICRNLFIRNIEIKSHTDSDVKPYVNEIEIDWVKLDLPAEFVEIKNHLEEFIREQILFMKKIGFAKMINTQYYRRTDLLMLQGQIRRDVSQHGKEKPELFMAASKIAALLKVLHAHTLIETQGVSALQNYFDKMLSNQGKAGSPKALNTILKSPDIIKAIEKTQKLSDKKILHPKLVELQKIITLQFQNSSESKIIVFNHYRDSINSLVEFINSFPGIKATKFVGQAMKENDEGMSQKEQIQTIQDFKEGKFNVLCCSSIGEEGLDLPSVDLVVFYEPVPSEIRTIQRTGRTGRFAKGKVIILMAKNTSDEGMYYASRAKEKKMKETLHEMKNSKEIFLSDAPNPVQQNSKLEQQTTLGEFSFSPEQNKITIYVDTREQQSRIAKFLEEKENTIIKVKQLETADYVLSDTVAVERKTVEDFLASIIDGRLFPQLIKMNENYDSPLIILEGNKEDLFFSRNIHKNAIIGALTSIPLNYKIGVLFTSNAEETAEFLYVIAKREQISKGSDIRLRVGRKGLTLEEQQRYMVEGLPMVGPQMAKALLKHFDSIRGIANATQEDLQKIENLGDKKARAIKNVFWKKFEEK
ncbi:MAG: DEAD/DEAH box helicase [Candidatus Diapherotrites archaeon]|nr:DEAD/DEAH box helicase [Candidatus Diapherotrites archaeon]